MAVFLADGTLGRAAFRGDDGLYAVMCHACRAAPDERYATVETFYEEWEEVVAAD